MKRVRHPNALRWLQPPTIEQIDAVVKKAGVSESRFEDFHGIYFGCICHVRIGFRDMPIKHWHLFLDPQQRATNRTPNKSNHKKPTNKRTKVKATGSLSKIV